MYDHWVASPVPGQTSQAEKVIPRLEFGKVHFRRESSRAVLNLRVTCHRYKRLVRALCDSHLVGSLSASEGKANGQRLRFVSKHERLGVLLTFFGTGRRSTLKVHKARVEHQLAIGILWTLWSSRLPDDQQRPDPDHNRGYSRSRAYFYPACLRLPLELGTVREEFSIAVRTVCDVVPARILFQAVAKGPGRKFFQDRIAGTSFTLWVRILVENRVLKLSLESVELGVGCLVARHQSLNIIALVAWC